MPSVDEAEVLRVFTEALDVPPERRDAWVEERCGSDRALRGRVATMLEAERDSTGFLEAPLSGRRTVDHAGERLGAFEVDDLIALGGMSAVYRARRADGAYDQDVAIKIFDAAHLDPSAVERFDVERRIVAALDHPGIARIIDGGTAADGSPYVVMELVRGQPITRYCNEQGLDLVGRLELFREVCEALAEAHRQGIVHRDIKPGNVLVNEAGQPKLIDFGIAKVLDAERLSVELPETRVETRLMTPEYASPEQIRGEPVGTASDIYSLGVLLYELVAGTRPHRLEGMSAGEMEHAVCETVPADPSAAVMRRRSDPPRGLGSARTLVGRLKGDLDRIVMTAMLREPEQRYPSAGALADDIDRHLGGQPVAARGASRLYRAGKFVQRHRSGVVATVAAFVVLVGSLIAVSYQAEQARREAARAEAAKEFLVQMISRADPYENTESPTMAGAVKQAIPSIAEQFAGQPRLEAEMRHATGFALSGLGDTETARAQLEQALAIYERIGSEIDRARVLNALAGVSWDESDYPQADEQYRQALALVEESASPEARETAFGILIDWSGLVPKMEQSERGVELAQRAIAMIDALESVDPLDHAVLYNNLAAAYDALEDYDNSIPAYERSIELHRAHSEAHPDLATALGNLGLTYELVGEMDKAVETVASAVEMQRQLLGEDHPQYVLMLYNLGSLQINAGQLEQAALHLEQAVAAAEIAYSENHLYTGRFNHRLAALYVQLQRNEPALRHAAAAERIYAARDDVPDSWIVDLDGIVMSAESN